METIKYLAPKLDAATGQTLLGGWARMAVPIPAGGLRVMEVKKVSSTVEQAVRQAGRQAVFFIPLKKKWELTFR